jgi:Ca2+-binding RTX toxin-like protein
VIDTGNSLANTFIGNSAANTLDNVIGNDSLVGGAGDDYYISSLGLLLIADIGATVCDCRKFFHPLGTLRSSSA